MVGDATRLPGGVRLVGYASSGQTQGVHLGVPSATLTVILSLDGPVRVADTAEELSAGRALGLDVLVAGLQEQATHVVRPSHEAGVQIALDPLAARALFGVPAGQISASMTQAFDPGAWGGRLWQRVGETPTWEGRFDAITEAFEGRLARADRAVGVARGGPRREIAGAWRLLTARRGAISMDTLAAHAALSPRQFRDAFRAEFGVGPKAAARLLRFEHATTRLAAAVRARRTPSLAGVAADCGYADQSHLSREFRGFLGVPPSVWLEQERRNIQVGGHLSREDWTS
ncbi:putative AraC family transcriptional regulator [Kineosphaera limosa NBRC 100340]|uniref:Putative AraC family transcriptional regulator n=1 Tax=Kineosphaera limosa NBRC 100340 TaxID=1184609 RepID=K6VFS4_9MICO|nr:putative AraC family transcriptional regulator [Kineosphaera limosa NBRC 100340]